MMLNRRKRPKLVRLKCEEDGRFSFDPFQVFEVNHKPCLILRVNVLCGRKISKGWAGDILDTPDPYIFLRLKTAPEGYKKTKHYDNDINPKWNESFLFYLNPDKENILEILLMDANYVYDETIGIKTLKINGLAQDRLIKETLIYNQVSEVDIELKLYYDMNTKLRYSLTLCHGEKDFLDERERVVFASLKKLLGDRGPRQLNEVPVIGLLGSGGGFRAMTSLSGVFKALCDTEIINCITYMAGLSGSTWFLSSLYSHPDWPNLNMIKDFQNELKNSIDSSILWLLRPQSMMKYSEIITQKRLRGQPISFTDLFGLLVGETLIKNRMETKLSDQRVKVTKGQVPLPLYTCLHVKREESERVFQEWIEFSPFEVGMAKYGTFLDSKLFGSKFFMGHLVKEFPESPLHYLQGLWGSAFCISFKRLLQDNSRKDMVQLMRDDYDEEEEIRKELVEFTKSDELKLQRTDSESSGSELDEIPHINGDVTNFSMKGTMSPPLASSSVPFNPFLGAEKKKKLSYCNNESSHSSIWNGVLQSIFTNIPLLSSRAGRAGMIHNFLRGLSLHRTYPMSPFSPVATGDDFERIHEMTSPDIKKLYLVDGGLTFNSPYPLLLRPQRKVDIFLSFDFSARPSDSTPPFKELLLAEKWAHRNKVPFPPIDISIFNREGMKECYVFKHPTDPYCPIILHFVLVNVEFRNFKKPDIPRVTKEEFNFADFDLFEDPKAPYSTFTFKYTHLAFDRLAQLTEFNTLLNVDLIKDTIAECIQTLRKRKPQPPIKLKDIKKLFIRSESREELIKYVKTFKITTQEDHNSQSESKNGQEEIIASEKRKN